MAFKFVVLFSILVAVNAGHLSGYVDYAPNIEKTYQYAAPVATVAKTVEYAEPAIAKTVEYAAPVTKTIYQSSPVFATKSVYNHEPVQYNDYHAKTIAYPSLGHYGHGTVSHHGKVIATPHSYVNKYDTRIINEEPHYKYAVPAVQTVVKSPIVPVVKSHYEPEYHHSYAQAAPVIKSHYEPEYHHSYAQAAPVIKSHYEPKYHHAAPVIKTAAVSYSPATAVSHASFQSSNAHYGW